MTKTELLAAMAKRYREGRQPSQAGDDWEAGLAGRKKRKTA
jgi:hypothetical protein